MVSNAYDPEIQEVDDVLAYAQFLDCEAMADLRAWLDALDQWAHETTGAEVSVAALCVAAAIKKIILDKIGSVDLCPDREEDMACDPGGDGIAGGSMAYCRQLQPPCRLN